MEQNLGMHFVHASWNSSFLVFFFVICVTQSMDMIHVGQVLVMIIGKKCMLKMYCYKMNTYFHLPRQYNAIVSMEQQCIILHQSDRRHISLKLEHCWTYLAPQTKNSHFTMHKLWWTKISEFRKMEKRVTFLTLDLWPAQLSWLKNQLSWAWSWAETELSWAGTELSWAERERSTAGLSGRWAELR